MYHVLLVDDDRAVRYDLKKSKIWADYGFLITGEATNGQEALDKIAQTDFDLLLIDIKMPKIDGLSFLKEMRKQERDLCVVIASGYSTFEYARQGLVLGAFDYLLKPVENNKLAEVLQRANQYLAEKHKKKESHLQIIKQLEDSVHTPISRQEEQTLYSLFIKNPAEAPTYAQKLAHKISAFYGDNLLKAGILLDCLWDNLKQNILADKPWLSNFQALKTDDETKLQDIADPVIMLDTFVCAVSELATFIKDLHLDHPDAVIRRLCEYVLENIDAKITVETAAAQFGFSSSYLGKLFKQKTGKGFVDFITAVKMEKAKELIRSGKYKIYEISDILGYKSSDYFSALFKTSTQMTPAEYKKSLNKDNKKA